MTKRTITSETPIGDFVDAIDNGRREQFTLGLIVGIVIGAFMTWLITGIIRHW